MKKHLLFGTLFLSMIGGGVSAQTVSEQDAAAKAMSFFNQGPRRAPGQAAVTESQLELSYKSEKNGETYYYIFNDTQSGAFVIVAGDERATEILGYGDKGCIDFEQAPDNFKWWMSQYEAQIHAAIQQDYKPAKKAAARKAVNRTDIPEMITTKWSQREPFNNAIPSLGEGKKPLITGCVATAMAQVMKYHGCPQQHGVGTKSYYQIFPDPIGTVDFGADFGATTYDWANMLNVYQAGKYSDVEADAVAKLMYHAGVAVGMHYGQGASSASSVFIPGALSAYFGYDKSAYVAERDYYTDEEWLDLVYSELKSGRPLLYGGQDAYGGGGHEFVCHGYNATDETFAINWGWAGSCDGYFTLIGVNGLQPEGSGDGGAGDEASYTSQQDIVVNVKPDEGGKEPLVIVNFVGTTSSERVYEAPSFTCNDVKTTSAEIDLSTGSTYSFSYKFNPWNHSPSAKTVEATIMLKHVISGACIYSTSVYDIGSLGVTSLTTCTLYFNSSMLTHDGVYEVHPMVREMGTTEWVPVHIQAVYDVPTITVTGGESTEVTDITFGVSGNTVEQYSTLQITHDKYYNGVITYSADPSGIVSIDENGVVTGVKAGKTTITVKGEATPMYNETTATFDVEVTPYVKKDIEFTISASSVMVNNTIQISNNADRYTGTISYASSDNGIATVDATGLVTGISKGKAKITVTAPADDWCNASTKVFDVVVTGPGIALISLNIPNGGYVTMTRFDFSATVVNNTSTNWTRTYLKCDIPFGTQIGTCWAELSPFYSGDEATGYFDVSENYGYAFDWYYNVGDALTTVVTDFDGNVISDPITFTFCNDLTVTYTMSAAGWGTLCLPFEAEVPTGLTAYKVTGATGKYLIKEEVDYLEMNTPYLLSGNEGTYTFDGPDTPVGTEWKSGVMVGNTQASSAEAPVYAPKGSYVLQVKDGKLGFYEVENDNSQRIRQYSAYIQLSAGSNGSFYAVDVTDGIEQIEAAESNGVSYQINGMRLNGQAKGLSVKNGRIMFNK